MVKRLPATWKTRVQSLGLEDPLEKEMATHSSTLALKIPWTITYQAPLSTNSQARILKWVAIPFSRGSSRPRDGTWVSLIAGRFFII